MASFKLGLLAGFAAGYILGAKAGKQRYDQITAAWSRIKQSPAFKTTSGKVGAAVGLGYERGKAAAHDGLNKAASAVRSRNSG